MRVKAFYDKKVFKQNFASKIYFSCLSQKKKKRQNEIEITASLIYCNKLVVAATRMLRKNVMVIESSSYPVASEVFKKIK